MSSSHPPIKRKAAGALLSAVCQELSMFLQHLEADARTVERTSAPAGRRGLEGRGKRKQILAQL